jgi:biotin carboxyl carrier protein
MNGRPLLTGDVLPVGVLSLPDEQLLRRRLRRDVPPIVPEQTVRVTEGPQWDRFTEAGRQAFLDGNYQVTPRSNRQGIRLNGTPIEHVRGADIVSEGIVHGAVQVPGDGQPIVLLAARQTVGGYTKIATVIGADLDALGQSRPSDRVGFKLVSVDEARSAYIAYQRQLGSDAMTEGGKRFAGYDVVIPSIEEVVARVSQSWDLDGVVRVIAALESAGVTSFSIDDARSGFKLEIHRGDVAATANPGESAPADNSSSEVITAPVLGVFYRRSAPDQAPLAEPGQRIERGQVIGVLEVMKSYHEVAATVAGLLTGFLVEDGQFVEYGQPIARVERDAESPAAG